MRIAFAALSSSLMLISPAAQAEEISYNFLDAGYVRVDIDDFSEDADGFLLRGSFEVTENIFLFGGYRDLGADVGGFDIDVSDFNLGVGYAWPVGNASSLYGKLSYVSAEADSFGVSVDDTGYGLALGLRSRPTTNVELEGYVDYVDLSDLGDETSFGAAARFFVTPQFALAAEVLFGDESTSYGAGLRWHWGN